MDLNIQKYRAFIKTVEYGSFTKAAEALNYSQSGISRIIKDLENEWNVALLERDRGGVSVTSDGIRLMPYIKSTLDEYNKLKMEIDAMNGLNTGLIRIGSFSSAATHWLPNIIARFQQDYPNIDFNLYQGSYSAMEKMVMDGDLDCALSVMPVHSDVEVIALGRDPMYITVPEGHPLAEYDKIPIRELERYPFILSKMHRDSEVMDFVEHHKLKLDVHYTTWDDYSIMAMVEKRLGISMLSGLILRRQNYKIIIKELEIPAYREIGLIMREQRTNSLAVKRFIQYLEYREEEAVGQP